MVRTRFCVWGDFELVNDVIGRIVEDDIMNYDDRELRCYDECCVVYEIPFKWTVFLNTGIIRAWVETRGFIHPDWYACFDITGDYELVLKILRSLWRDKIFDLVVR